jgi:outer membrane protein assembly factor BamB
VSVVGDKVFTMGNQGRTAYLFALSRSTGKVLWKAKVGEDGEGGGYYGTRCTPSVDDDLVYGISSVGDLLCADIAKGTVKWRKNFKSDFGGQHGWWEFSESPLVDGDRLICTPGGPNATVVALDKKTGKEVWRCPAGDAAEYSSIVISNAGKVKQYVTLTSGGTIGVRASDGKLLWRYAKLGENTANVPTPIVLGDQIFTAAGYGKGGALLTLKAKGESVKCTEEYHNGSLQNKHGGVTIVGKYAYGDTDDNGNPYCADWKTGKVQWTRRSAGRALAGPGYGSASMAYADGHLYIRYADGTVQLVPASASGYRYKSSFKIPNSDANSWAHPVVIGGRLYLREKDTVWCYNVEGK